jgi:hypothetical protein
MPVERRGWVIAIEIGYDQERELESQAYPASTADSLCDSHANAQLEGLSARLELMRPAH